MADLAGVAAGQRILDVGCGPGALVAELVVRGAHVSAVDPSAQFVSAARERYPDVDVRQATAEELPFEDASFDAALAQLVVHFMADPVRGIAEMARVTVDGGVVAASVWDLAGGKAPISPYWRAARQLDPGLEAEDRGRAGAGKGQLVDLFQQAGLTDIEETALPVQVHMRSSRSGGSRSRSLSAPPASTTSGSTPNGSRRSSSSSATSSASRSRSRRVRGRHAGSRTAHRTNYDFGWPASTSPRQAPLSAPRASISSLKRSRSPLTRRLSSPAAEPSCSAGPSAQ